ncbi:MAG: FKBP-type peptidyl-prolyl cis-trans isomerase N-terminal domain-containing protein, partial [Phycisphaeraceae bacterium]
MHKWYGWTAAALIITVGLILASVTQANEQAEKPKLETVEQRASYAIGVSIGRDMMQQGLGLDGKLISRGLLDALEERDIMLTDEELQQALMAMQEQAMEAQMRKAAEEGAANRREGEAFLEA